MRRILVIMSLLMSAFVAGFVLSWLITSERGAKVREKITQSVRAGGRQPNRGMPLGLSQQFERPARFKHSSAIF